MSEYRFRVEMKIYGYIDAEIGEADPEQYAEELIETGITVNDLTYIADDDVEIDDWAEL